MPKPRHKQHIVLLPKVKEIRVAKAAAGVTYQQMASDMDVARWQLEHALRGHQSANRFAEKVAEYFGKNVHDLFIAIDLENPNKAKVA